MKDEEDWSDGATDKPHGALGLDLDSLSQSLQCIPLHDRLGIEEKLFSHDQQYELTSAAKHNRTLFEQNHKQPRNIETIGVKTERKKQSKRETHSGSHKKTSKVTSKKQNSKIGEKVKDGPVDNGSSANQLHNGSNDTSEQTKDVLELEDDLDALLELDDSLSLSVKEPFMESYRNNPPPVKPQSTKEEPSPLCATSKADGDTEKADCAMEKEASKNVCNSNSTGNLEDWLDDMLDD